MKSHENAFEIVSDDPAVVRSLDAKASLSSSILDNMKTSNITQVKAAEVIGCTQPRISRMVCGRLSEFSLGWLYLANEKLKNHIEGE